MFHFHVYSNLSVTFNFSDFFDDFDSLVASASSHGCGLVLSPINPDSPNCVPAVVSGSPASVISWVILYSGYCSYDGAFSKAAFDSVMATAVWS